MISILILILIRRVIPKDVFYRRDIRVAVFQTRNPG